MNQLGEGMAFFRYASLKFPGEGLTGWRYAFLRTLWRYRNSPVPFYE